MPLVTFVHGIAHKPEAEALRRAWERSLADDDGLDLGAAGVTTTTYAVRDEIRRRVVERMTEDATLAPGDRHVLVSHSMGAVIAYDCLRRVPACPGVDARVTVGSPLGLDETQDQFQPEWTRDDGFPTAEEVRQQRWVNGYDRLDPVRGFDPVLGGDYRRGGAGAVEDGAVTNVGRWRHGFADYAACGGLREALRDLLGLPAPL